MGIYIKMCYNFSMKYDEITTAYYALGHFNGPPGLQRMRALCQRLGQPQKNLRCIHIAGTNGKGSCAALLAAILRADGQRVGLFTSPDLTDMRERIQINGAPVSPEAFIRASEQVFAAAEEGVSFFDAVTAAAFLCFREAGCEVVVLECGLGGRFDATNVIDAPLCSVIMPIGLDHTAVLGSTLAAIAAEKAGIFKPGCPAVIAPQESEARETLRLRARQSGVSSLAETDPTLAVSESFTADGQVFSYKQYRHMKLSLLGPYQILNACTALECALVLGLPESAVREGLQAARWPCRFEIIRRDPVFLLDSAHNPHGAEALAKGLRLYFPGRKFTFLIGMMADKDYRGVLRQLQPLAERFICFAPDRSARALSAAELAACVQGLPVAIAPSYREAAEDCLDNRLDACALGSLYYIGHLRDYLLRH